MTPFVYGFPGLDLMDKADAGEVILGGCGIGEYQPTHYCNVCQEQYPSNEVEYFGYDELGV
jgi:hypothetical protein